MTIGLALVLVFSDEASEASEEILCWSQDEERCFVFLPSYADLSKTEVQLNADSDYRLGGVQLTQGLDFALLPHDAKHNNV